MPRRVALLVAGGLLLAGCSGTTTRPDPDGGTLSTPSAASTAVFDCGTLDVSGLGPAARRTRLGSADVCLRDALTSGQPARFVRVAGDSRTTYQVTGRGELAVTVEDGGAEPRHRRCTGATGLFLLGRCTRDPGAAR